jgi:NADH-quinone oxidoreductase subunit L
MTIPLVLLAAFAVLLGVLGTPLWPWFAAFLRGEPAVYDAHGFMEPGLVQVMLISSCIVFVGLGLGWLIYGIKPRANAADLDAVERAAPGIFHALAERLYIDELYAATVFKLNAGIAYLADWMDRYIWSGAVRSVIFAVLALSRLNRSVDNTAINGGFDAGCTSVSISGKWISHLQNGQVQRSLRVIGIALVLLLLGWFAFLWSVKG